MGKGFEVENHVFVRELVMESSEETGNTLWKNLTEALTNFLEDLGILNELGEIDHEGDEEGDDDFDFELDG
jgi:hypothetical protein